MLYVVSPSGKGDDQQQLYAALRSAHPPHPTLIEPFVFLKDDGNTLRNGLTT